MKYAVKHFRTTERAWRSGTGAADSLEDAAGEVGCLMSLKATTRHLYLRGEESVLLKQRGSPNKRLPGSKVVNTGGYLSDGLPFLQYLPFFIGYFLDEVVIQCLVQGHYRQCRTVLVCRREMADLRQHQ